MSVEEYLQNRSEDFLHKIKIYNVRENLGTFTAFNRNQSNIDHIADYQVIGGDGDAYKVKVALNNTLRIGTDLSLWVTLHLRRVGDDFEIVGHE